MFNQDLEDIISPSFAEDQWVKLSGLLHVLIQDPQVVGSNSSLSYSGCIDYHRFCLTQIEEK